MKDLIFSELQKIQNSVTQMLVDTSLQKKIEILSSLCAATLKQQNKILFAGNGGSAADAQHLAAELVSRLRYNRPGLSAIALTTDTSALTAIGNDYGYDVLFSRQLEAIGKTGDIFIGISTSGDSVNILNALQSAKKLGITTIGFTSQTGGKMSVLCDHVINVPATETPKIQECHTILGHILCALIEETLFGKTHNPHRKKYEGITS